jgi:hypothetical protein
VPRGVCRDPHFHYKCASPRFRAALPIAESINTNTGIVGVNQSSGNMNNQASAVSFSAITSTVVVTTP